MKRTMLLIFFLILAFGCTMPPYWERLFGRLGMEVPQDNPGRMSESACLIEVNIAGCFN